MKHIFLLSVLFLYAYSIHSQGDHQMTFDLEDIICKETAAAERIIQGRNQRNEFAYQTDMHYQVMRWDIDPSVKYIHGDITYYFTSLVPQLEELILDLNDVIQINSITRNGTPLSYTHGNDDLLIIELSKTLAEGEFDTLSITYEGVPPANGLGSFEQNYHSGAPIIWTLSEPYGARDWWPAKQDLIDKIDSVDIYITTPEGNLAASNGKLMSSTPVDGVVVHHWRHRYPIVNYLIALSVTNYAAYNDFVYLPEGDSIEILNYVYPESLNAAVVATESSVDIMELYNELFGLYPFAAEKYGHAQFGWGGGEEHQTMSFMGNFSFGLQAHEMAHQWFGNKVTCGSWTDIWLNEGFATYLTGLTYENFSPDEFWPLWKSSVSNSATSQTGGSVWVNDTTSVNRIFTGYLSYNKGAYLLHMLRWTMGDTAFFQGCRNYLDGAGTAYDFGRTDELKEHLEAVSGRDYDEFLDDWFYGQGYPSYDLRWTQESDSVIVWVGQRQSHNSVDFYEMPIPILVRTNLDSSIFRVEHLYEDQRFSFYVGDAVVDSVGFDPDKWILSRNNTIEHITTSIGNAGNDDLIQIYPNPAFKYLEVFPISQVGTIQIVNATGGSSYIKAEGNMLDIQGFPAGLYTLLFRDNDERLITLKRIVIVE